MKLIDVAITTFPQGVALPPRQVDREPPQASRSGFSLRSIAHGGFISYCYLPPALAGDIIG